MKKKVLHITMIAIALILSGCGTANNSSNGQSAEGKIVSGREIIVELEQTVTDTTKRDAEAAKVKETPEYKQGAFGETTPELAEDLAVQQIEFLAALEAIELVYGGSEGFQKEGVLFLENQSSGAEQSGFWIGIKDPDKRVDQLKEILQEKVDAGEILAKYIFIFKSAHSEKELHTLTDEVSAAVKEISNNHEKSNIVSWSASANIKNGAIEIGHNFLTEEQIEQLQQKFPKYKVEFTIEGRLVPKEGEPDVEYPANEFVSEPSKEGAYIVSLSENNMMIVDATPANYGNGDHYSAINYTFPEAIKKLKVGQRIIAESSGPIMESYPAQGTAMFAKVLPEYKPANADLSESLVIQEALKIANEKTSWVIAVKDIVYNAEEDQWYVNLFFEDTELELKIEDK